MTKEEQFEWLKHILKENNIKYWADFGTLLGLIRDKKLIKNDGDIDLGLWEDQIDLLEQIKQNIIEKGYVLKKSIYKGYIYQYSFKSINKDLRHIDFHIFRKKGDIAWSLQKGVKKNKSFLFKIYNKILGRLMSDNENINVDKVPYKWNFDLVTWIIDKEYFEELIYLDNFEIYIPKEYDKYLTLHYGNWRVPAKGWNYLEDDGALKQGKPELYLENI